MQHYSDRAFIEQYPLNSKKIWKKMISAVWTSILIIGILGYSFFVVLVLDDELKNMPIIPFIKQYGYTILTVILCIFVFLLIVKYSYQKAYIKNYYYNVTDKWLIIRKGAIAQQEITVPFERIQDVYVDQDLFDVMFGLYDVHISTATATSGVRAHIDGVEKRAAEEIRQLMLNKIHCKR